MLQECCRFCEELNPYDLEVRGQVEIVKCYVNDNSYNLSLEGVVTNSNGVMPYHH